MVFSFQPYVRQDVTRTMARAQYQMNANVKVAGRVLFVINVYQIQSVNMARVLFPGNVSVTHPGEELIVIKVSTRTTSYPVANPLSLCVCTASLKLSTSLGQAVNNVSCICVGKTTVKKPISLYSNDICLKTVCIPVYE